MAPGLPAAGCALTLAHTYTCTGCPGGGTCLGPPKFGPGALPKSERHGAGAASTRPASRVFNFLKDYVFILKDVVSCFLT